jgi:DNA repair protein RadA/Sms
MAKRDAKYYVCENCGADYLSWQGKCDNCGSWNTIVEHRIFTKETQILRSGNTKKGDFKLETLASTPEISSEAYPLNNPELERVLGGGLVKGAAILLTGEPGVGKSTILISSALELAATGVKVTYISAEEAIAQVVARAKRVKPDLVGEAEANLGLMNLYNLEDLLTLLGTPDAGEVIILDSIQTISSAEVRGVPGGQAQVRYCAAELISACKQLGKTLIIVGHVNKEGEIAGPKLLEHLVDVVLNFSAQGDSALRALRAQKNRFGSTEEVGLFLMEPQGLQLVANAADYFLNPQTKPQVGSCRTVIMEGNRPLVVEVQALAVKTSFAYPKRVSEGISSARLQLITAVLDKYLRLKLYEYDLYFNVAKGFNIKDRGADLAAALAIISSVKGKALPLNAVAFGELSLSGQIAPATVNSRRVVEVERLSYRDIVTAPQVSQVNQLTKYLL